jgi:hypothetical protein
LPLINLGVIDSEIAGFRRSDDSPADRVTKLRIGLNLETLHLDFVKSQQSGTKASLLGLVIKTVSNNESINHQELDMTEDPRCCGSGTCIINPAGRCWCGQQWDGDKMCFAPLATNTGSIEPDSIQDPKSDTTGLSTQSDHKPD